MAEEYRFVIKNIRLPFDVPEQEAVDRAVRMLKKRLGGGTVRDASVYRRSLDCRKKPAITTVYSVLVSAVAREQDALRVPDGPGGDFELYRETPLAVNPGTEPLCARPVVVGFGPCGMFCALLLAEAGYRPIVLERGADVDERTLAVAKFKKTGVLDPNTNIQFGAGGAGTFSDGKLTTRISDPFCRTVLERFVEFGAPASVLKDAKPHVGTDVLTKIVSNLRDRLLALGCEIRFGTTLLSVTESKNDRVRIRTTDGELETGALILALGHSARDTYEMLLSSGYPLIPKAFSVGVRIEHLQRDVDFAAYGSAAGDPLLPPAEYHVSHRKGERGVYSFCMCPGGEVVAAASEEGGVVVNGMSPAARNGKNANAAIATSVLTEDFGNDCRGAIAFQRALERGAFAAGGGGYTAPVQTVGDFLGGTQGTEPDRVQPTYRDGNTKTTDLHTVLPPFVTSMLEEGLRAFPRQNGAFADQTAVLTGVETRTSAPIRICRTENYTVQGHPCVYPCGEGAGYAGGITSAAVDGLHCAVAVIGRFAPPKETSV